MMGFWIILYIIDGLLFLTAAGTTLYMLIYAVASLFNHHKELPNTNRQNRFIILIPAYKEDAVIENRSRQSLHRHTLSVFLMSLSSPTIRMK